jgi:muconolactone delta-isomerase
MFRLEVVEMLFMVVAEFDVSSVPTDPQQLAAFSELVLIPSLEMVHKLEKEGTILAGGICAAGHRCNYIVEAPSSEELSDLIQAMPGWIFMNIETTPLESTEHRITSIKERLERLKALVG